jgi:TonB family protein
MCILLLAAISLYGQDSAAPPGEVVSPTAATQTVSDHGIYTSGFRILSKNIGEGPGTYVQTILTAARRKWYPKIPELQTSGQMRSGTTILELEIKSDGSVDKIETIGSSGSNILDDTAKDAVTSSAPFGQLPADYRHGLKLQLEFAYRQPVNVDTPFCDGPNWGAHPSASTVLHRIGHGVTPPHPIHTPDPEYSDAGRQSKYQSTVMIAGTVDPDGAFTDLCLAEAAGYGLDRKSFEAVRTWTFQPATQEGAPVAVRIVVETTFRLY